MYVPKKLLLTRVYSTNPIGEIRLLYALVKSRRTSNFPLNLTVQIDSVKYRLVDFESLCIASPNFEAFVPNYLAFKEGDVFLDIGAHIGKYSLRAAKQVGPTGRVISIEADCLTFEALKQGIIENGYGNITPLNVAAFNIDGLIDFYVAPQGGVTDRGEVHGKGGSSIKHQQNRHKTQVMAKTLDKIVNEQSLTRVDFIKIDAEGAEVEILEGARNTILQHRPTLIVEAVDTELQVKHFLKSISYSVIEIAPGYYCAKPT